jgi:hypothetical protein
MDHNPSGGGYSLRTNILATTHAPGSIHRSASRRKNGLLGPQVGPIPQPDFGAGNAKSTDPLLADASMGQFDDAAPPSTQCLAGSKKVTPYLGDRLVATTFIK